MNVDTEAIGWAISKLNAFGVGIKNEESAFMMDRLNLMLLAAAQTPSAQEAAFQDRVQPWMMECFGKEISSDAIERNHRFLEEALELVQSCGCTQDEAHQLVDYVYGRPSGETHQEVGGVMVTLAALCLAHGLDMHDAGEVELARIWTKVEQIRAKKAAKPRHSPLPSAPPEPEVDPVGYVFMSDVGMLFSTSREWCEKTHVQAGIGPIRRVFYEPQDDGLRKAAEEAEKLLSRVQAATGFETHYDNSVLDKLRGELDKGK